ncbi:MAG: imidazoleglycerol-phosphate dehydratase HisB [Endomicrobium sp.]|jgi:imidazoleglycerol-phosphate dehydratase|nr:imidazoleglycerol-phosphate dehydratase HisB [Endomicrobium sp.]
MINNRNSKIIRKTKETCVSVELNLDKCFLPSISTTIGFLDHMLNLFAVHSSIGFKIKASGDTYIDEHHLVEDSGITIGKAIKESIGNKKGIMRYGHILLPMDESLSYVALDISGRPYLNYEVNLKFQKNGFNYDLIEDFFYAIAINAGITLHIKMIKGRNNHHIAESIFKAFGHAFKIAIMLCPKNKNNILSTKGIL